MTEIYSSNIPLKIGQTYTLVDKDTESEARCTVIREATREEYIEDRRNEGEDLKDLGYYYEVSID